MTFLKNKLFVIFFVLLLSIAATVITGFPVEARIKTIASVAVIPDTVELGKPILVNGWITPQPQFQPPPWTPGLSYYNEIYIEFTNPSGATQNMGPQETYGDGTFWFSFVPDALGEWSVKAKWAGDAMHEGCESPPLTFTVQNQPLPSWPAAELPGPNDYWSRPVSSENREWYQILGSWSNTGRNERDPAGSCYNPYSKAPNTAHILWKFDTGIGGLIGGEYGTISYNGAPSKVIMAGRAYFTRSDGIHCIDIRTGKELWVPAAAGSGSLFLVPGPTPYIWTTGTTNWVRIDGVTGRTTKTLKFDMQFVPGETFARTVVDEAGIFYFQTYIFAGYPTAPVYTDQCVRLVKWDSNKAVANWSQGIIWEVKFAESPEKSTPEHPWHVNGGMNVANDVVWLPTNGYNLTTAFNATTGELLYRIERDYWIQGAGAIIDGIAAVPSSWDRRLHGYNLYTGEELWQSEQKEYPWGAFSAYQMGAAYGNFYWGTYDGQLHCINAKTGKTVWKFYAGDSGSETPYGTWPMYSNPAIADGKIYWATNEHSPTQPYSRGYKLNCLDAKTGDLLWSISGANGHAAIAENALIASDLYTSYMFCFDKGLTAVKAFVSPKVTVKGSSVLIEGTVMDMSPAQPNTPCVSDDSMTAWMEYLHMQKPKPTNTTGVTVKLTATDADGKSIDIGTTTSTADGNFAFAWTPSAEGTYWITAKFEGSGSYYSSSAETAVSVTAAMPTVTASVSPSALSSASPSVVPQAQAVPATELYIAIAAAVIIAVVVAVAMLLRRRK